MKTETAGIFKRATGKFLQRFVEICPPLLILRNSVKST
jgi:hypothetical protein